MSGKRWIRDLPLPAHRAPKRDHSPSIMSVPPIQSRLLALNHAYGLRIKKLDPNSPVLGRLSIAFKRGPNCPEPPLTESLSQLSRIAREFTDSNAPMERITGFAPWSLSLSEYPWISIESGAPSKKVSKLAQARTIEITINNRRLTDAISIFTDGSSHDDTTGAAFSIQRGLRPQSDHKIGMGRQSHTTRKC
jgi:hypothetical protein